VVGQSAERLRALALLYAFVFVMAAYVPALFLDRSRLFSSFLLWGPGVIAIAVALLVAVVICSNRVPWRDVLNRGLAFGIS
jgi:hypothetical protein